MNMFYYLSTKQYIQGGPKTDCFLKFVTSVPQFAIHQILAFFVKNKNAIKVNNLILEHWLNILCKRGSVKWRNCYQRTVKVTQLLTCTFIIPEFIDPENWPTNSQYLNPVDFSVWGALRQKLYR